MIRLANGGIEPATIDHQGRGGAVESGAVIQLERSPGEQPFFVGKLGKAGTVPRLSEPLPRGPTRRLMLAVTVAWGSTEDRDDYLRTIAADDPDYILEHRIARPVIPGVFQGLGESEIVGPGEELGGAIQPSSREQLFAAEQPQRFAQFASDQVLSTLSPIQRQIPGLGTHASDQDREQLGILIVGVGGDHQHPLVLAERPKGLIQGYESAGRRGLKLSGEGR